jgi:hypothetical protein
MTDSDAERNSKHLLEAINIASMGSGPLSAEEVRIMEALGMIVSPSHPEYHSATELNYALLPSVPDKIKHGEHLHSCPVF